MAERSKSKNMGKRIDNTIEKEIELEITGLTHQGAGVGRAGDLVLFVSGALPGDRVRARITEKRKRFALAEREEILRPSADRIAPACRHAAQCGGCQFQELDYAAQLRWKQQQVEDALRRIGKIDSAVVSPVIGMEHPYEYRNKAQFPVGFAGGVAQIGFYRAGSHTIVDLEECSLQHPLIVKLMRTLKNLINRASEEWRDLQHAVVRVSFTEENLMLALVTRSSSLPDSALWREELLREVPELVSIVQNINRKESSVVWGEETNLIWGEQYLFEQIGTLRYAISPGSFFQVNTLQTRRLYDLILDTISPRGGERVVDLYSGAGTIALYIASQVREVVGVESFAAAVEDASYNAELNGISNAHFLKGLSEEWLPRLVRKQKVDWLILDPPREGCAPSLIETAIAAEVPHLLYVSCNPATLARDLGVLVRGGYRLDSLQPIDLFPWTHHVESVALLSQAPLSKTERK